MKSLLTIDHPVFCFRYLHPNHHLKDCTDGEKVALIERLVLLSKLSWSEIMMSPRHGIGSEKIALASLKTPIPVSFTEDVTFVLAFRFKDKAPFVGYRNRFIFHILFIDRDFTLYDH